MKSVQSVLQVLKLVAKYGAYIFVIVDVVNYAVDRIQQEIDKEKA